MILVNMEEEHLFADWCHRIAVQFHKDVALIGNPRGKRGWTGVFYQETIFCFLSELEKGIFGSALWKCEHCLSCYLRGLFLACGRISDPQKQYRLEFSLSKRRSAIAPIFESIDLSPKYADRRTEQLIYFKSSTSIEDFFTMIGDSGFTMEIMNQKILRQMISDVNRKTNAESHNIRQAVSASMDLIDLLDDLVAADQFSLLPEELKVTANLRLQNREMSVAQLASISTPTISKSGMHHRLKKIEEIARQILKR